jgi:bifunctional non-homologous end joining protein LigD
VTAHRIGDRVIEVTSPTRSYFPADGISKAEVVAYYAAIAEVMFPHLAHRLLTVERFPRGTGARGFFQKNADEAWPDWIARERLRKKDGDDTIFPVATEAATIPYLANKGCIVFHAGSSRVGALDRPDRLIFDLDPDEKAGFDQVRRAAEVVLSFLGERRLPAFAQVTGSKGLHLVVPLDRSATHEGVARFAALAGEELVRRAPRLMTLELAKDRRGGKLYLDMGRNHLGATYVVPYSLRPKPGAPAATPIRLDELATVGPRDFGLRTLPARLRERGDPWADMDACAVPLPAA